MTDPVSWLTEGVPEEQHGDIRVQESLEFQTLVNIRCVCVDGVSNYHHLARRCNACSPTTSCVFSMSGSLERCKRPGQCTARTSIPIGANSIAQGRNAIPFPPAQWKQSRRASTGVSLGTRLKDLTHFRVVALSSDPVALILCSLSQGYICESDIAPLYRNCSAFNA